MKIDDKIPPIKIEAYIQQTQERNVTKASEVKAQKPVSQEDKVVLSQTARQMNKIREQLDSIPDVREEKVEEIKNQIDTGTYTVEGKKIAFNMLKESVLDEFV